MFRNILCITSFWCLLITCLTPLYAKTYYVRCDGDDANSGNKNTAKSAWRTIDRGQPTFLMKSSKFGDSVLHVLKANQFPPRGKVKINNTVISYTGRTLQALTGCKNVSDIPAFTKIWSVDYTHASAGDTIIIEKGVYSLSFDAFPERSRFGFAIAMFFAGGKSGAPLIIKGNGLPVIDAGDEPNCDSLSIQSDHIQIENLDIRRGGIRIQNARRVKLLNCRIHQGDVSCRSTQR